jgi:hypothetical protein
LQSGSTERPRIISRFSIVIAALFILGLAIALWFSGGAIFNPGPVIAKSLPDVVLGGFTAHAEFENQCDLCHQPLRTEQAVLCLECHVNVAGQIETGQGAHGHLSQAQNCASCHAEHQGRDFDPVKTALDSFDHSKTRLPLAGKHALLACSDCHTAGQYDQAQPECRACHAEPPQHTGMFDLNCAECHTAEGWKPAVWKLQPFNHAAARFTLDQHADGFASEALLCVNCHSGTVSDIFDPRLCIECHSSPDPAFMPQHQTQFGSDCITCHDGVDRMHGFDHQALFPLEGRHAELTCETCHAEKRFRGTPALCADCHSEPDIHAGSFGLRCQYCHTSDAWQPALLRLHTFPLDHGGKGELDCQTCHGETYPQISCSLCHEHDEKVVASQHASLKLSTQQLADCLACHADGQTHR